MPSVSQYEDVCISIFLCSHQPRLIPGPPGLGRRHCASRCHLPARARPRTDTAVVANRDRGVCVGCFLPCLESVFPVAVPPEVTTPPKPGRPRSLAAETWLLAGGRRPVRDSRAPGPGPQPRLAQRTSQKTGWHGAGMERARRRQTLLNVGLLLKRSWGTTGEGPRGKPQRRRRPRPARQQEGGASGERAGVPRRQQWPPRVGGGRRPRSWGHEREESQSRFCRSCRARGKHVRD